MAAYMIELTLFLLTPPNNAGMLNVGDGHSLYWEESGCPQGIPVLVLHGGPGTGIRPMQRRVFYPDFYRTCVFS